MKDLIMVCILAGFGIFLFMMIVGPDDGTLRNASADLMQRQIEFSAGH